MWKPKLLQYYYNTITIYDNNYRTYKAMELIYTFVVSILKNIEMNKLTLVFEEVLPILQEWLRATINEEVTKALEADRARKRPTRQLSREDVCKMLGVSLPTLWKLTKEGKLKANNVGRRVVYDEREIQRFLAQ